MNKPLISILICCHNRAHLLSQTMESVFAQTYEPVEIVVLDDGSTDETPELMASYGEKVRYYWQENQGISATRTAACNLAKGEYIAFQDDDDLMVPDRIALLYEALCSFPSAVFALGDRAIIDGDGNPTGERIRSPVYADVQEPHLFEDGYKAVLMAEVDPVPHTTVFRKVDGDRIGWFDSRFIHGCEDTDFFLRLGQLGPIVYIPKVVSYYRKGHNSLATKRILMNYSRFLYFEKHLQSIAAKHVPLKKLLRFRLLGCMKNIAFYENNGVQRPASIPDDYLGRGLALLDLKGRLLYKCATLIKFPIRRFISRLRANNTHTT